MSRSGIAMLLGASALVGLVACGEDDLEGERFGPDDGSEIVAAEPVSTPDDDCEVGVCSPKGNDSTRDEKTEEEEEEPEAGPVTCETEQICSESTDLGTVSGDEGNDSRSRQGASEEWFTVDVTENNNSPLGKKLKLAVTLVSPKGRNFDLLVFDSGCASSPTHSSTQREGTTDKVTLEWGEGFSANGKDDKKTIRILVKHVAGTCEEDANWTLVVTGNAG